MVQKSNSDGGAFAAAIAKASPRARAEAGGYTAATPIGDVIAKMARDIAEGADRAREVQDPTNDGRPVLESPDGD
jgi:hypothetical protein